MLRKLNFTDRRRIPKLDVRITLRREDGVLAFDPVFDLDAIEGPPDARLFIEAHYRTSYMRFDCGTIHSIALPKDRRLTEIDSDNVVDFQVKIIGPDHRVLAVADGIRVAERSPDSGARVSLLPVNFRDLGEEVWHVAFEVDGPVLELNNRLDSIEQMARLDPIFFALVYPGVVRIILTRILLIEQFDFTEESEDWWALWFRWARERNSVPLPDDVELRAMWIDDTVQTFCRDVRLLDRLETARKEAR